MGTINFINIGSGSKGNASFFYDGETLIQFDMGLSLKSINSGLSKLNLSSKNINAIFITHNHDDHVKTLCTLKDKDIYARKDILKPELKYIQIKPLQEICIGKFKILPFNSSHDAPKSVNYIIYYGNLKLAYVTDTGVIKKSAERLLINCDMYYFESNYDIEMLHNSGRPLFLIERIEGPQGHLGNEQAASYLAHFIGEKTQKIYLAHLSEECNTEQLALNTIRFKLNDVGVYFPEDNLIATKQREVTYGEIYEY